MSQGLRLRETLATVAITRGNSRSVFSLVWGDYVTFGGIFMSRTSMDMTRGSLKKQILFFSIPLMLSNLLQVLFNMSDIAVIGQFAGAMSLGAVGSTTTLISMYTGFLIGLSGGINVLTALYIGARNRKSVSETVHSAFLVSLAVGLILLILGVSTSRGVLVLLNTKEELIDKAALYIRIYFLGIPALALYNFGNAVFSAAGDIRGVR